MIRTLLIAGANGQLGRCLVDRAIESDLDCVAFGSAELDICEPESLRARVHDSQPDILINAAAYTAVDKAESHSGDAFRVNETGVANLAEVCAERGIPLIHISTDYVFGGDTQSAYREGDRTDPVGVYGASKLAGERAIQERLTEYLIVRTSWVYSEYGHNFVKTMLRLAKDREHIQVVSDQYGRPTYAGDLADAILAACANPGLGEKWGIYHFAGADVCSWSEFARNLFAMSVELGLIVEAPKVINIASRDYPAAASRPLRSVLDSAKFTQHFGVEPVPLADSLRYSLAALAARSDRVQ